MSLRESGQGRRFGAAAVAAAAALVVPALPIGTAEAASGRCPQGTGVTVVVDYGPLGNGVGLGCDPDGAGEAASEVVPAAGFPLTYAAGEPFVCRISGLPNESQESCARTPPEDAYWALYWSDGKSDTWNYATIGVTGLEVPEGGSIGWRFQDGGARENPSAPPTTAKPKPTPTPEPSKSPTAKPSKPPEPAGSGPTSTPPASAPPTAGGASQAPGVGTDSEGPEPEKSPDEPGTGKGKGDGKSKSKSNGDKGRSERDKRPRASAEPGRDVVSESPTVAALEPTSSEPMDDRGSSTALNFVAGGAVLLLAGAAGVIAWRRRA